jgi:hypothetical protein
MNQALNEATEVNANGPGVQQRRNGILNLYKSIRKVMI